MGMPNSSIVPSVGCLTSTTMSRACTWGSATISSGSYTLPTHTSALTRISYHSSRFLVRMMASISLRALTSSALAARTNWSDWRGEGPKLGRAIAVEQFYPRQGLGAPDGEELLILGLVDRVVGIGAAQEALAALGGEPVAEEEAHVRGGGEERDGGIEIGHVHELPLTRAFPREQGEHDAEGAVHARPRVVGHEVQRDDGLAVRLADQVEHAGQREIVHVVGGIVAVGPILTETGERAVHEPRIVLAERLVVGAESLRHPGAEAFDDDVDACRELPEERLPLGRFHVEGDGALVPVNVGEAGAALAVDALLPGLSVLKAFRPMSGS